MVSWGAPEALVALAVPAVAAIGALMRHRARLTDQRRLASGGVWRRTMGGVPATGLTRMLAWCAAAAMVVVALARPMWGELPREAEVRTRDVVVAVDVSDSMRCPDLAPSRLAAGLGVLRRALPQLEGNRLGVVVFAGDAYALVPITIDLEAVATFLEGVEPGMVGLPGSNLERAVTAAGDLLPDEGSGRVLVVVTDGENLQGDVDAAREKLHKAGIAVVALVTGTKQGGLIPVPGQNGNTYKRGRDGQPVVTRADFATMKRLAGASGAVVDAASGDAARRLAEAVARIQTRSARASAPVRRVERFPVFLGLGAVFLVIGFLLSPWRRVVAVATLLLVLWAPDVSAQVGPNDQPKPQQKTADLVQGQPPSSARPPLWQRLLPGGARRLARAGLSRWKAGAKDAATQDFGQAFSLDPADPARRYDLGTSLAAKGQLKSAVPLLSKAAEDQQVGTSAAYNLGTAALEAKQAQPAVKWLRHALLADPRNPDVKRNYELAMRLLEQQKQQKQQKKKQKNQDKKDQKKDQEKQRKNQSPSPTPTPSSGARPTPTPGPNPIYGALERSERQARRQMAKPTPSRVTVEKDW